LAHSKRQIGRDVLTIRIRKGLCRIAVKRREKHVMAGVTIYQADIQSHGCRITWIGSIIIKARRARANEALAML
jgi:ribosomal protein L34